MGTDWKAHFADLGLDVVVDARRRVRARLGPVASDLGTGHCAHAGARAEHVAGGRRTRRLLSADDLGRADIRRVHDARNGARLAASGEQLLHAGLGHWSCPLTRAHRRCQ